MNHGGSHVLVDPIVHEIVIDKISYQSLLPVSSNRVPIYLVVSIHASDFEKRAWRPSSFSLKIGAPFGNLFSSSIDSLDNVSWPSGMGINMFVLTLYYQTNKNAYIVRGNGDLRSAFELYQDDLPKTGLQNISLLS